MELHDSSSKIFDFEVFLSKVMVVSHTASFEIVPINNSSSSTFVFPAEDMNSVYFVAFNEQTV